MLMQSRGFTLIELLVVIAIIGILASIVLVSLSGARGKARDAQRVANIQEMAKAIMVVDPDTVSLTGAGCVDGADASLCTGPAPVNFARYKDPATPGTVCTPSSGGTCQYMITGDGVAIRGNNFQLCTYLEVGLSIGGAAAIPGVYSVSTTTGGSVIRAGC